MQNDHLTVSIITPQRVVEKTTATSVILPSSLGEIQILPNHAPLIAEVGVGPLLLAGSSTTKNELFITDGYVEVANNEVNFLVRVCEYKEEIDYERAKTSLVRANSRLAGKEENVDRKRAEQALARAEARLRFNN